MKLRTFTGLEKECTCACGCNQKILARPDVQVVVDMDSPKWKRDRYLPGHAGNGYGSAPYAHREKKEEPPKQAPTPAPPAPVGPAPQGPSPASPQPQVDPVPVPTPKVRTNPESSSLGPSEPSVVAGTAPSLADNRPWKILQVTISVGDYSSVKAGVADFGRENESLAQLGSRLVAELTQDIKTELDVVHQVQAGKPLFAPASQAGALSGPLAPRSVPTQGVASTPVTPSAPSGAAAQGTSKPAFTPASALAAHYEREKAYEAATNDPETLEAIRRVHMELGDISVTRAMKKGKLAQAWLENRGYERLEDVDSGDLAGLRDLLVKFEMVNEPEKFAPAKATGQGCGTPVYG